MEDFFAGMRYNKGEWEELRMKPIALLYTGGTIGARVTDGAADAAPGGGRLLTEVFRRRHPDSPAVFDEREPLTTLSENMTVEKWNTLLDALRGLEPAAFAGVILTHGTDTLAYTANLLALALEGTALPVILVSSHTPPTDPAANGHRHFAAAVQAIAQGHPGGVYAAVSDLADAPESREVRLIPGERLTQCAGLTDRFGVAPAPPRKAGRGAAAAPAAAACRLRRAGVALPGIGLPDYRPARGDAGGASRAVSFRHGLHGGGGHRLSRVRGPLPGRWDAAGPLSRPAGGGGLSLCLGRRIGGRRRPAAAGEHDGEGLRPAADCLRVIQGQRRGGGVYTGKVRVRRNRRDTIVPAVSRLWGGF